MAIPAFTLGPGWIRVPAVEHEAAVANVASLDAATGSAGPKLATTAARQARAVLTGPGGGKPCGHEDGAEPHAFGGAPAGRAEPIWAK